MTRFVTELLSDNLSSRIRNNAMQEILENFVYPLMSLTTEDEELNAVECCMARFSDMVRVILTLITTDPTTFLENQSGLDKIFRMCKRILTSDATECAEKAACLLLEKAILTYLGHPQVDEMLEAIVHLMVNRIFTGKALLSVIRKCILVVMAGMCSNVGLVLQTLSRIPTSKWNQDVTTYFIDCIIHTAQPFYISGALELKLCWLALCCLLDAPDEIRPDYVNTNVECILQKICAMNQFLHMRHYPDDPLENFNLKDRFGDSLTALQTKDPAGTKATIEKLSSGHQMIIKDICQRRSATRAPPKDEDKDQDEEKQQNQ